MASLLDQHEPLEPTPPPTLPQPSQPPAPSEEISLGLRMQQQLEDEWCWAAVSTSLALFFQPSSPWTQCEVVNAELGQTTCCQDGGSSLCNQPWDLTKALQLVRHWLDDFEEEPSVSGIAEQLTMRRPVCLCINWTGGGGHFVSVDGIDEKAGQLHIADPLFGPSYVAYDGFPASYQGGGIWGWTYLTK